MKVCILTLTILLLCCSCSVADTTGDLATESGNNATTNVTVPDEAEGVEHELNKVRGDYSTLLYFTSEGLFCREMQGTDSLLIPSDDVGTTYKAKFFDGRLLYLYRENENEQCLYSFDGEQKKIADLHSSLIDDYWIQTNDHVYMLGRYGVHMVSSPIKQITDNPKSPHVNPIVRGSNLVYVTKAGEIIRIENERLDDISHGYANGTWAFDSKLLDYADGVLTIQNTQVTDIFMGEPGVAHRYTYELSEQCGLTCIDYEIDGPALTVEENHIKAEGYTSLEPYCEHMIAKRQSEIAQGLFPVVGANGVGD